MAYNYIRVIKTIMHTLEHEAVNVVIILGDRQYNNCMDTRIPHLFYESDIKA